MNRTLLLLPEHKYPLLLLQNNPIISILDKKRRRSIDLKNKVVEMRLNLSSYTDIKNLLGVSFNFIDRACTTEIKQKYKEICEKQQIKLLKKYKDIDFNRFQKNGEEIKDFIRKMKSDGIIHSKIVKTLNVASSFVTYAHNSESNKKKKEYHKKYHINWYKDENNRKKQKEYRKIINSKPETKLYHQKKYEEYKQNNLEYKLINSQRKRIKNIFKYKHLTKKERTIDMLGCSGNELKKHLEKQFKPGMTWENYGFRGWQIDHVCPINKFDLNDPEQVKLCFHHFNLQPLWWWENLAKNKGNYLKKRVNN